MKIGFLCLNFYPYRGGCEDITFNIAKELAKNGHDVHVYTANPGDLPKDEEVQGIKIHRTKRYFRYKYYIDFTPGVIGQILSADLDVLHVQSIGFLFNDIAVMMKKLLSSTRIVNTPHGPFMALEKYPWWQEAMKHVYRFFEKPINSLYDGVVQVNPFQYSWMERDGFNASKIKFIPNSVPEEIFKKVDNKDFIEKYNLEGKLVLSYIGRIQRYKGLDQVVRALPDLLKINKDVVFLAMGSDAGDTERLKRLAEKLKVQNHVIFTGFISEDDKLKGLDTSDIFVFPSEWEAFGIVLIEAMARNNAVVSTKTEGGRYLVEEGINGYLYDFEDVSKLKEHLFKMISDPRLLKQMKETNLKKVEEYKCENVVKKFEKFYARL